MASRPDAFMLFLAESGGWRVAAVRGDADVSFQDLAAPPASQPAEAGAGAVVDLLKAAGYDGRGVLLALPSSWCMCAPVAAADLPPRNRRQAMTFRLEEKLPVSAEQVVADFVPGGEPALGVCVETRRVAPLVDALESRGVAVQSIAPASMLTLQDWAGAPGPDGVADLFLWGRDGQLELVAICEGRPRAWSTFPDDGIDAAVHVGVELLGRGAPARLRAGGVSPAVLRSLATLPALKVEVAEDGVATPDVAAARAGALVLAGKSSPWVELRRDALAPNDPARQVRRPLTAFAAAAVLLAAALSAAMFVRAGRYDERARRNEQAQRAVFQQAFPGRPVPVDVRSRLASEAVALRALNGGGDADAPAAATAAASGLVVLRDALSALPRDVRFRVAEVRLDEGRLTLEGQTRSHGDANAVAAALRRGGRFDVAPPRTEQLTGDDKGVSFSIAATVVASPPRSPAGPPPRDDDDDRDDDNGGDAAPIARRPAP